VEKITHIVIREISDSSRGKICTHYTVCRGIGTKLTGRDFGPPEYYASHRDAISAAERMAKNEGLKTGDLYDLTPTYDRSTYGTSYPRFPGK
jgi:hypothetical protein